MIQKYNNIKSITKSLLIIFLILTLASCQSINNALNSLDSSNNSSNQNNQKEQNTENNTFFWEKDFIKNDEKEVKVGLFLPLSGKSAKIGNDVLRAVQMAIFDSRDVIIRLSIYDTEADSFKASEQMKKALQDGIEIVVGPLFSGPTQAVGKIARDNNIPVLSLSNNYSLLEEGPFLLGFSIEQQIEEIVKYTMEQGLYNFAIIAPKSEYGAMITRAFKEIVLMNDGLIIKTKFYNNNKSSIQKTVAEVNNSFAVREEFFTENEIKNENADLKKVKLTEEDKMYPEAIFIAESGKNLNTIADLINENGEDVQLIGIANWNSLNTLSNSNLVGSWFTAINDNDKKFKKYRKNFYKIFGSQPMAISSIGYDAIITINELVRKGYVTTNDSLIEFKDEIYGFEGVNGIYKFLPNGAVQRKFAVMEVGIGKFNVLKKPDEEFLKY